MHCASKCQAAREAGQSAYPPRMSAVRENADAYARYLKGMDASMRVKVALTAAHVLSRGRAADMGMGSGSGSAALAGLYPELEVIGVDLDPALVERARREHVRPNLTFQVGDIAQPVLSSGTMDAIFDSSVLHHVTSFNGYDRLAAQRALEVQARALRENGVLIVRDFLDPKEGSDTTSVELELPAHDGDDSDDPKRASSAALLERFSREFRSLHAAPGFPLERIEASPRPIAAGHRRYRLALRHAVEFVLRKDYREDWAAEAQEEYTFATQRELEQLFVRLGLRVLTSSPLRNPWIVRHRFEGKFKLTDSLGQELDPPATNYVLVGQRVPSSAAVTFEEMGEVAPSGFLELSHHEHVPSGAPRDLVRRTGVTLDIVPYFRVGASVSVMFRASMPRPISTSSLATPGPCGTRLPEWMAEPLHARMTHHPLGQTVEAALKHFGIDEAQIRTLSPGTTYYPSPGGIQEEVRSVFVEIEPRVEADGHPEGPVSERLQAASAEQLLRAAQVGGLPEARLEINVRTLLQRLGLGLGPWLGAQLPKPSELAASDVRATDLEALIARPPRRAFRSSQRPASFLALHARRFVSRNAAGDALGEIDLDVVVPAKLSTLSVACLPIVARDGVLFVGIDDDDLPAAQAFSGSSALLVAPAFRVTQAAARSLRALRAFAIERLASEYDLATSELIELGGRYCPSPGMTPEVVYPFVALVTPRQKCKLAWVPLSEAYRRENAILDGHLRVLLGRAAQAFEIA